jgi:hypothetical protein
MTLGEALEILTACPIACACSGPGPWPGCYCGWTIAEARALHRAAHIAARQIADLAASGVPR